MEILQHIIKLLDTIAISTTRKEIESLAGGLNWLSFIVTSGPILTRDLYEVLKTNHPQSKHVQLPTGADRDILKSNLKMWYSILKTNPETKLKFGLKLADYGYIGFTDASGTK